MSCRDVPYQVACLGGKSGSDELAFRLDLCDVKVCGPHNYVQRRDS